MTILVLDKNGLNLRRYAGWLADNGRPLIGFTGAAPADRRPPPGYALIQHVDGYAHTAALELAVLRLAATTEVTGIVATGFADLLRAAALREYLGVRGQHRAGALAATDLIAQRDRLTRSGIPVVPSRPVGHPAELCRQAAVIGYPIRVRRRRTVCWPSVARLDDRAHLLDFLARHRTGWHDLVVEPDIPGERLNLTWSRTALGSTVNPTGLVRPAGTAELGAAVATALPEPTGPLVIDTVRHADGVTRVDSVSHAVHDPVLLRATVREHAGLTELAAAS